MEDHKDIIYITGGYMIDPASGTEGCRDLILYDGKIAAISEPGISFENLLSKIGIRTEPYAAQVKQIDASGKIVAPGLVDVHVHFRDPGFTYKENIESGAKAAAKGGFTSVVLMANTKPAVDNTETLNYVIEKGKEAEIHIHTCANVTLGLQGQQLVDMERLSEEGAVGFTDDGIPILSEDILRNALICAAKLDKPVSLHEEDPSCITNNGINAGKASAHFGIVGSPREAEIRMVERDLEAALSLSPEANLSIQHISTKEAVELVRQARKKSNHIHAEATPHHFTLTEEAAIVHGTLAKMNPPLRTEEDRMAIIEGLRDGTIDMIATDHAPHSREEKNKPITEAPSGIIGLETSLSLGIRELVEPGYLTMMQLLDRMSTAPAALYHLPAGYLAEGGPADMVIFDRHETWKVEEFVSRSSNSPFAGETLPGVIAYTICEGKIVYQQTK